jgi:hypothetical protein
VYWRAGERSDAGLVRWLAILPVARTRDLIVRDPALRGFAVFDEDHCRAEALQHCWHQGLRAQCAYFTHARAQYCEWWYPVSEGLGATSSESMVAPQVLRTAAK